MEQIINDVFIFRDTCLDIEKRWLHKFITEQEEKCYVPKFKGIYPMNLKMNCFGKHWSAIDNKYHDTRVDYDNQQVEHMPSFLVNMVRGVVLESFPYHRPSWDICLMNIYEPGCTLGVHQDNSESKAALKIGHPVVSLSLGAGCIFKLGPKRNSLIDVQLNDGDIIIFGGESRLIYHGVDKILSDSERRINFTLRKF